MKRQPRLGSATVPVALAGVSPASLRRAAAGVSGGTPKTAVETTAIPKQLMHTPFGRGRKIRRLTRSYNCKRMRPVESVCGYLEDAI